MIEFLQSLASNPAITSALWPACVETLQMVGLAGLATVLFGLPLGVILFITQPGGLAENRSTNLVLGGFIVNITRAIPSAILMLTLVPFTWFVVGTSIGPIAASLSLTIASVPFFARLVEASLREVHPGKVDAAHAMGSSRVQTIWNVLLPEARPSLVANVTTTVVALIGYSAMAGLIGGGSLAIEKVEGNPYANLLVWRTDDTNPGVARLEELLHSTEVADFTRTTWPSGDVIPGT